jgi:NADH-quinone oxidoreductase subunit F
VDIRVETDEAPPEVRAVVDALLGPKAAGEVAVPDDGPGHVAWGGHASRERRHLLLPVLHALQARFGWLSSAALGHVARRLEVPPAEIFAVASFYHWFSLEPRPPVIAHVCDDVACQARGAEALCARLEAELGPEGAPTLDGRATWHRSPCLGICERAPGALVVATGERPASFALGDLVEARALVEAVSQAARPGAICPDRHPDPTRSVPQAGDKGLELLARVGRCDPTSLAAYDAAGGYEGLRRALSIGAEAVRNEVTASKLVGRGGAAFSTGRKWTAVAGQKARPHFLVCNADESEPGTFKDRVLLEEDPFAVIEGMTIAAFATGCERGYVYLRAEYPEAAARLEGALEAARRAGRLGARILGSDLSFDVLVRRGAAAYVCGEETALFASIEGFRGEPRSKPPFPVEVGLFGRPTAINNVETLANVPLILRKGGAAFARAGTADSSGTKLFCVSGHVERPGLYEVPFGATLGDLIALAGGVRGGRRLLAVLLGGAAGTFVGPERLSMPLTFEGTRALGATVGSGAVVVLDETTDLAGVLLRIGAFFRAESCGQCVPCRVGTVRQEELLVRLAKGRALGTLEDERALHAELGAVMRDASICGLGQTASSAIASALARWDVFRPGQPAAGSERGHGGGR